MSRLRIGWIGPHSPEFEALLGELAPLGADLVRLAPKASLAAAARGLRVLTVRELNARLPASSALARTERLATAADIARQVQQQSLSALVGDGSATATLALVHALIRVPVAACVPGVHAIGDDGAARRTALYLDAFITASGEASHALGIPVLSGRDVGSWLAAVRSGRPLESHPRSKARLSVVTIAKNEERDLPYFLASFLPHVDEIVIADDGSSDRTVEIARAAGERVRVVTEPRRAGEGFQDLRNRATDHATGDWLLHVDVDMRLSREFARELRAAIDDPAKDLIHYRRDNYFLNQPLSHAGGAKGSFPWLVRSGFGRFVGHVHEQVQHEVPESRQGTLECRMPHLGDDDFEERLHKNVLYSSLERRKSREAQATAGLVDLLVRPGYKALRSYLYNGGVLDGRAGFFWALYQASSTLNRYLLEYSDVVRADRDALERTLGVRADDAEEVPE